MSAIPDVIDQQDTTPTTRAGRARWRLAATRWHRRVAVFGATTLLLWGLSGLLHPLLTTFGPQQKVFYPPRAELDLAGGPELDRMLAGAGIDAAAAIRVVAGADGPLLQVTTDPMAPRRYLSLADGTELLDHDAAQALFLARHYLQLPDAPVLAIEHVHGFSAEYPEVNRLLPVWRVRFDTPDALTAWVYTETSALAAVGNRFKSIVQGAFQLVHTWSWLPAPLERFRVGLIAALMIAIVLMAVSGAAMLVLIRRKARPAGGRHWHRTAAWVLLLPALMFSASGLYHLLNNAGAPRPAALRLAPPLAGADLRHPLRGEWPALSRGLAVSGVSVVQDAGGAIYYRLALQPGASAPTEADGIRNARFDGVPRTGPALYIAAASGEVWPAGDRELALQLGERWSGLPRSAVHEAALVTRFGPTYDFRNKRLPVWRLDYGPPVDASLFVDTATGALADVLHNSDRPERYVFSFVHKWNFLFPLGRDSQNLIISAVVTALLAFMAGIGLALYRAHRRARSRLGQA